MTRRFKVWAAGLLLSTLALPAGVARAQDVQSRTIKLAFLPTADHPIGLGANATPLPIPEVYAALETGAVDGMDAPLSFIRLQKYDEVQKHLVLSKHVYNAQAVLVSKKFWDRLSEDEHKILQDSMREAQSYQRQVSREKDVTEPEALKKTMEVTELPAEESARMQAITSFSRTASSLRPVRTSTPGGNQGCSVLSISGP
jgi:TRAP-type C4-dicarboxylate transport system substrate-binding protein